MAKAVTSGIRLDVPDDARLPQSGTAAVAYVDLMRQCWAQEPRNRPSFSHIIAVLK